MRFFMDISYRGSDFHGWQSQKNASTVQETIEQGLRKVLQTKVPIMGSGRTDTGVHAKQQIAHFDLDTPNDIAKLQYQLNAVLPKSVSIQSIVPVQEEAHARFDAERRKYDYYIHNCKDPFKEGLSYYFHQSLDLDAIAQACEVIRNTTDFESFSRVQTEVNHFNCDIYHCQWSTTESGYQFTIEANRFLRGMVRALVGTLIDVGLTKLSVAEFALIVERRNRRAAGAAAPAQGLYLSSVSYPTSIYITN